MQEIHSGVIEIVIHVDDNLAVKAKAGDRSALLQVWKNSKRIRHRIARSIPVENRRDWENESFLGLLDALERYDNNAGHFDTYLTIRLKACRRVFVRNQIIRIPANEPLKLSFCEEVDTGYTQKDLETTVMPRLLQALTSLKKQNVEVLLSYIGLDGVETCDLSKQRRSQIAIETISELQATVRRNKNMCRAKEYQYGFYKSR